LENRKVRDNLEIWLLDGRTRNIKRHLKEIGNDGGAEIVWIKGVRKEHEIL
jgi:hypothetical protein